LTEKKERRPTCVPAFRGKEKGGSDFRSAARRRKGRRLKGGERVEKGHREGQRGKLSIFLRRGKGKVPGPGPTFPRSSSRPEEGTGAASMSRGEKKKHLSCTPKRGGGLYHLCGGRKGGNPLLVCQHSKRDGGGGGR